MSNTFSRENRQTGRTEQVTTDFTLEEIAARFAATAGTDNWLWFWMTKHVEEQRNGGERRNMIAFLQDSFLYAIGMGASVKRKAGVRQRSPMIRLWSQNRRYKIYLSRRGTLCIKSGAVVPGTADPVGDEEYVGCLVRGKFIVSDRRKILPEEQETIDGFSADPVGFFAKNSKDMGRCCYCNAPLEDQRSKDVGYGPICAQQWGLPWGKSYDDKVPSFADAWSKAEESDRRNVRMLCSAIRSNPFDADAWAVLGDALEQAGVPGKPACPPSYMIMPQPDEISQGKGGADVNVKPVAKPTPVQPKVEPKPAVKEELVETITRARIQSGGEMDYNADEKRFSTELSQHKDKMSGFVSIIELESPKTKKVIPFLRQEIHRNNDNEVTHADYSAIEGGYSLVVFND